MVFVYNPTNCLQIFGHVEVGPHNFAVVTPEMADIIKSSGLGLRVEGEPGFFSPFKRYGV